ncbi:MAG: nuclear transport factor 2 family protein [Pseudomonadota bacterium]
MDKRAFVETWYRRVWSEEDLDAIDELMAPTGDIEGLESDQALDAETFRAMAGALLQMVRDVHVTVDHFLEDGDWVSFIMRFSATCRASGNPVSTQALVMACIRDGQVQKAYNYGDFISLWEQLGKLPQHTMQTCLAGNRVG